MPAPSLRHLPLAAILLLAGCFFTEAPIFTPDDLVDPDPDRYHEVLLVPDTWDDAVPQDAKGIPDRDAVQLLVLEDGVLREKTVDVWTGRVEDHPNAEYASLVVARVGGEEFLMYAASLKGENGQYNVEPFYRVVAGGDAAPTRALLLDEDWLGEHFTAPYDEVNEDPKTFDKLPADDRAMIGSQRKHGISLTTGRETYVHGPTPKLQAFMLDQKERIFRLGHDLRRHSPEVLASLREEATARRLAWLRHALDQGEVSCVVHRQLVAMEPHAGAIPALAAGLEDLQGHAKYPRLAEAEETAGFMAERGLARQLGRLVVEKLLPEARLVGHGVPDWHLSGRSLVLHLRVDLEAGDKGRPQAATLWFQLTVQADGRLAGLQCTSLGGNANELLSKAGHDKLQEDRATLRSLLEALRQAALEI